MCDIDGGELYQRSDDKEDVVKERLKVYHEQTKPLESFYKNEGILIDIDATKSPQALLEDIKSKINDFNQKNKF